MGAGGRWCGRSRLEGARSGDDGVRRHEQGERARIQIRVRTAMSALAQDMSGYLGGRPAYGYRLVDAEPHPNPAKAISVSGSIASNPTPLYRRLSSGFTACMPMAPACATSRNSSPTMVCRHRASMARRGIVIVTREDGRIRRFAPYSTTRRIAVSVFGASRRNTRSWSTLTMSRRGMRPGCGGVIRTDWIAPDRRTHEALIPDELGQDVRLRTQARRGPGLPQRIDGALCAARAAVLRGVWTADAGRRPCREANDPHPLRL
ncbi:hypothetical protein DE4576_05222 [Mycobacterium marinum]|nr:hypothetical protein DE4576_05222 [Mycobacterium marinum]